MKYSQIRIGLLTLTIGIAVVPFVNGLYAKWDEVPVNLPQAGSEVIYVVVPTERNGLSRWQRPETGHGCGGRFTKESDPTVGRYPPKRKRN